MTDITTIILNDLPKLSLNEWYSGSHWSKRKDIKDVYKKIVKNQYKHVFSKNKRYHVNYAFTFRVRPLDASNTIAMVKLIEDIIFEDDKWDIVKSVSMQSKKGSIDQVIIEVIEFDDTICIHSKRIKQ